MNPFGRGRSITDLTDPCTFRCRLVPCAIAGIQAAVVVTRRDLGMNPGNRSSPFYTTKNARYAVTPQHASQPQTTARVMGTRRSGPSPAAARTA